MPIRRTECSYTNILHGGRIIRAEWYNLNNVRCGTGANSGSREKSTVIVRFFFPSFLLFTIYCIIQVLRGAAFGDIGKRAPDFPNAKRKKNLSFPPAPVIRSEIPRFDSLHPFDSPGLSTDSSPGGTGALSPSRSPSRRRWGAARARLRSEAPLHPTPLRAVGRLPRNPFRPRYHSSESVLHFYRSCSARNHARVRVPDRMLLTNFADLRRSPFLVSGNRISGGGVAFRRPFPGRRKIRRSGHPGARLRHRPSTLPEVGPESKRL